ncbi:MAG: hypothetical protein IJA61_02910 [Clostridia bacterium]|nr:hypothetical protein [Clostridia bacterium]
MKNKKDNTKTTKLLQIIILIISILLAASIIFNIYQFYHSRIRLFDSNLGENIEVEYTEQSNFIIANIVYPSNLVNNISYMQKVSLKSCELEKDYFVRAKVIYADHNIINESIDVEISPESDWLSHSDSYYYLNSLLTDWKEVAFINQLTIPKISTSLKNNTTITIYFEFLDSSLDVYSIWDLDKDFFSFSAI